MSTTTPTVAVDGRGDVENPPAIKTALDKGTRKEGDGDADGTSQKTNLNKKMDKLAKREEKQSFWKLHKEELWSMVPYLWPKEQLWIKFMLICAIFSLLASKLCSVTSPIALKIAVDRVSENRTDIEWTIVAYGALRFGVSFFSELKDKSFVYVSAHASRKISLRVFTHVMNLSLRFHITRKTGAVIRG